MNVCVDENIPRETVEALRAAGHDVWDLRQTPDQGTPDPCAVGDGAGAGAASRHD